MFLKEENRARCGACIASLVLLAVCLVLLGNQAVASVAGEPDLLGAVSSPTAVMAAQPAAALPSAPGQEQPPSTLPPRGSQPGQGQPAPALPPRPLPGAEQPAPILPPHGVLPEGRASGGGAPLLPGAAPQQGLAALAPPLPGNAGLAVCLSTQRVWGLVNPGETVTVTVGDVQMGAAQADGNGFFWTTLNDAGGHPPNLSAGDEVGVFYGGTEVTVTLRAITASVDVVSDVVSGTIGGVAAPISVTVYAPGIEPSPASYSQTVSSDGGGQFVAGFRGTWDFVTWDWADVAYRDGDVEVHRHAYPGPSLLVQMPPWNSAMGHAEPDTVVTATLYDAGLTELVSETLVAGSKDGGYQWNIPRDLATGDVVKVELADSTVLSRTVYTLTLELDAAADRVTGQAEPNHTIRALAGERTGSGWHDVVVTATVKASGVYTVDLAAAGLDLLPGRWLGVFVGDGEGDDLNMWRPAAVVAANQTWDTVTGFGPFPPGEAEGRVVTLTLDSAASGWLTRTTEMNRFAGYVFDGKDQPMPDIRPGDVLTVEAEGDPWQGVVQVQTMTVQADLANDRFTGTVQGSGSQVEMWGSHEAGYLYPVAGTFDVAVTAGSPFIAAPPGFDVRQDVDYDVFHITPDEQQESISAATQGFGVYLDDNALEGVLLPPGTPFTITLRDGSGGVKAVRTGTSGAPIGDVKENFWSTGRRIETGDRVQVRSGAGFSQTLAVPALSIEPDEDADVVRGHGPANAQLFVEILDQGQGFVSTGSDGRYAVAAGRLQQMWGDGDLAWSQAVHVRWWDENRNWVQDDLRWPGLVAHYTMDGWNEIYGWDAFAGNTILVTVTHPSIGTIYTATTTAGACDWCGAADYQVVPPPGTVAAGNAVAVDWGDGYTRTTVVFDVAAEAEPDTDVVTITTDAPEGTGVWLDANGPDGYWGWADGKVDAGGVVTFALGADYGYDFVLGTEFYVYVRDRPGVYTRYTFHLPAPELAVSKWNVSGHARPGGVYVYGLWYENQGNGVATDTLIVDTLPLSTTYAGDTGGFPHVESRGVVTWSLGELDPGKSGIFMVTINVSSTVPTGTDVIAGNCVAITTTAPGDWEPGDNNACSGPLSVWRDGAGVTIDKWANPGDPHPGQEFDYQVRWCSDGGAAAGPVWLTDTLPPSTTLLYWQPQESWQVFWNEVVTTGGQLVLAAPGLPGNWCQDLNLRLRLDPAAVVSTTLSNHVVITTPGDVDPNNNERWNDFHVGPPRADMNAGKWLDGGVLAPGGRIDYGANWWNAGNVAVHAWLTDTLPAGTTYRPGSARLHDDTPFEPVVAGNQLLWDLGLVPVNDGFGLNFTVDISGSVPTGTVLNNCVTVGITTTDDHPWDNTACAAETVREPGPNLRIEKWHNWNGDGQLGYQLRFQNIGTETANEIWVTDTLPLHTAWDGWWDMGFKWSRLMSDTHSAGQHRWQFSEIYPGDSGWLYFNANLDDWTARPRWYTNTAAIALPPGDVEPYNNLYEDGALKGEVDRAEMWVAEEGAGMGGRGQPNAPVTVTVGITDYVDWINEWGDWNVNNLPALAPGAVVTVQAGSGLLPVVVAVPDPFSVTADSDLDRVWGQVDTTGGQVLQVHGYWPGGYEEAPIGATGLYTATFGYIPPGARGHIRYDTWLGPVEVVFHRRFWTPDLILNVDYSHDYVYGWYEPGHSVWLTTTGGSAATAQLTTGPQEQLGWESGFYTQDWSWSPGRPDIAPGDWVSSLVTSAVYTAAVRVGTIDAEVDVDDDTISGTISAPWLEEPVTVRCEVHEENGPPGVEVPGVDPDGGHFLCDLSAQWDLQPGHNAVAGYIQADGHLVRMHPWNPAPHLRVEKWSEGIPGEGGNLALHVRYRNEGDLEAPDTVIIDTLQGMTYLTDTSGLPHTGSGAGPIVWDVGTLVPYTETEFVVFVQITEPASHTITNTVEIATSAPWDRGDPGEKRAEWSDHVWDNATDLWPNKWPWTGDPAPDTDFVYTVQACNGGPDNTDSTQATLTDTLDAPLTLVDWWADDAGWQEVSRGPQQLVLSRPTIDAHHCLHLYLRVHLTATALPGDTVCNTALIHAANDTGPDNNESVRCDNVNGPHTNLWLNKDWGAGSLVPGGEINYWLSFGNGGNVPVGATLRITDTLPVSTTFTGWQRGGSPAQAHFVSSSGGQIVWEVYGLENGFSGDIQVFLRIDPDAEPGTVLTNTAEIGGVAGEDNDDDNRDVEVQTVNGPGPNLRVRKSHNWQGNFDWLQYNLQAENIGDEAAYGVVVSDTYPAGTSFAGGEGTNFWEWPVTFTHDLANSRVIWELTRLEPGWSTDFWFNANLDAPGERYRWYTNTSYVTLPPKDPNDADNEFVDLAFTGPEVESVDLDVYRTRTWGCGYAGPITITTATTETVVGDRCWDLDHGEPFLPGDMVTVTAGAGNHPLVFQVPDPFTGTISSTADRVTGRIDALDREQVEVNVPGFATQWVQTDASGHYTATYPDIPRGATGDTSYWTTVDYSSVGFHRRLDNPDLVLNVHVDGNNVWANYEAGHDLWITVTKSGGLTYTAVLTTWNVPWWGGEPGFETQWYHWSPSQPDIEPGDTVDGQLDNGFTSTVKVGTITGHVDAATDSVTGTVAAGWWLPQDVQVHCLPNYSDGQDDIIQPDGSDVYSCAWNPATEWDILPGQGLDVRYTEPDGDLVWAGFHEPASDVWAWKEGLGQPAPGGNYAYRLHWGNQGDAPASGVLLTDTLPAGMSYLTDTSGLAPALGAGTVTWDLDDPDAWVESFFDVFMAVSPGVPPGTVVTNTVDISSASYDTNQDNNHHEWPIDVRANDTDLNVGKSSWTGDPAPDSDLVFQVGVCNNGSTASSRVTLSDTLHPSMTLQTWWSEPPGWTEVFSDGRHLVVSYPSLTNNRCDQVYLRVHVAAAALPGAVISNTAVITAANDLGAGDNRAYWEGTVNGPHTNLRLDKWFSWGQLVPGGELRFGLRYSNEGNWPADGVVITDTLPVSTSLLHIYRYDRDWRPLGEVTPEPGPGNPVVWNLGRVENGEAGHYEIELRIDDGAPVGTILTNTAEISRLPGEDSHDDNAGTAVERVYGHGPNLRVHKSGGWHGDSWGHNAWYNLTVENVGDVGVEHVEVTDSYPPSMTISEGPWFDPSQVEDYTHNYTDSQFTLTFSNMHPAYRHDFGFNTAIADDPVPFGWIMTNTVEIEAAPGEPTYDDNHDVVVLTTGPDLWVKKELVDGKVLPGEILKLSLPFGNGRECHEYWWGTQGNVWVTDTLPVELEFITSTLASCGWCDIEPRQEGNSFGWQFPPHGPCQQDQIVVLAQVTGTVVAHDVFTNWVEIRSDQPAVDVEPDLDDNVHGLALEVVLPAFEVDKAVTGSRVAGTVLTYTLAVTNTGNAEASGVVLSDTLPAGLIYGGGDGLFVTPYITWTFPSITTPNGTAHGWFSATLPCTTLPITNDDYLVVASDQGVTGSRGPAVRLDVSEPEIEATLAHGPAGAVAGDTVHLTATAETDGTPVTYKWDLGHGPVSGGLTASHVFAEAGSYPVVFTATDACGYSAVATTTVVVRAPNLVARFQQSATSIVVGSTVYFTDTSATSRLAPDAPPIVAWWWNLGDGSPPATTQNVSHRYTQVGTYTVTLVVTDALGYSDAEVKPDAVAVQASCVPLTAADWTFAPARPFVYGLVSLSASYQPTAATAPLTYTWTFGDGATATTTSPSTQHVYSTRGIKTVLLQIYNPCTPAGIGKQASVEVLPLRFYLPLILRHR